MLKAGVIRGSEAWCCSRRGDNGDITQRNMHLCERRGASITGSIYLECLFSLFSALARAERRGSLCFGWRGLRQHVNARADGYICQRPLPSPPLYGILPSVYCGGRCVPRGARNTALLCCVGFLIGFAAPLEADFLSGCTRFVEGPYHTSVRVCATYVFDLKVFRLHPPPPPPPSPIPSPLPLPRYLPRANTDFRTSLYVQSARDNEHRIFFVGRLSTS